MGIDLRSRCYKTDQLLSTTLVPSSFHFRLKVGVIQHLCIKVANYFNVKGTERCCIFVLTPDKPNDLKETFCVIMSTVGDLIF